MEVRGRFQRLAATLAVVMLPNAAAPLDRLDISVAGGDAAIEETVRNASSLLAAQNEGIDNPQDLFAAALSEYGKILGALYASGHYSGRIEVRIDGREAASISPLDPPRSIGTIAVRVDPGPQFTFSRARIAPLAPGTELPEGIAPGKPAPSGVISEAATAAVNGWRGVGYAKADITRQDVTADHRRQTLDADIGIAPGPRLRFGALVVKGNERMRLARIRRIADLPEGKTYDPEEIRAAADRLRRTGVFSSVTLREDEAITDPDLLGVTATLVEEKLRRYSFGVELSSSEGATVSGFWLHRNLLGGAERLRFEGSVAQLGAADSGADYALGVTLERPATLTRDTTALAELRLAKKDEDDYTEKTGLIGLGFSQYVSERFQARAALRFAFSDVTDIGGRTIFRYVALPVGATWDNRDSRTDAKKGTYLDAEIQPFYGLGTTGSGARLTADARAFRSFGEGDRVTLAARLQLGAIFGSGLTDTPRNFLFYSGGGGTVRGQPFQSLGITDPVTNLRTGGTSLLVVSAEARVKVTEKIGVVGFVDAGKIGSDGFLSGDDPFHAGAGLGVRYATGFGPIRLDIAAPVAGDTGSGVQIYVGIGQSF